MRKTKKELVRILSRRWKKFETTRLDFMKIIVKGFKKETNETLQFAIEAVNEGIEETNKEIKEYYEECQGKKK